MSDTVNVMRRRYTELLGHVPKTFEARLALARRVDRLDAIAAVESFRDELLHRSALDRRTQQLVHFAMLIASGEEGAARLHAVGAIKAGASLRDLFGVCETAAVVGGMPAFSRAVGIVGSVIEVTDPAGAVGVTADK